MSTRTVEQTRAASAWRAVNQIAANKPLMAKYVPLVQGAPVDIHTAGFGQAVAFYLSRKPAAAPEYDHLLRHLAGWLLRARGAEEPDASKRPGDLMVEIQSKDLVRYRQLHTEALAYLAWLKRFAAALDPKRTDPPTPAAEPHA